MENTTERRRMNDPPDPFDVRVPHPAVNKILQDIYGPRQGGLKICIDAASSRLGVGKTSAAVWFATELSYLFDYALTFDDFTLDGEQYKKRWREHDGDSPSVIVLDEISGAGIAPSRKAMTNSNQELARTWELMRTKKIVTITTCADLNFIDSALRKLLDIRIHMLDKPLFHAKCYEMKTSFSKSEIRNKTLGGRIRTPNMTGHPFLEYLDAQKLELLSRQSLMQKAVTVKKARNVEFDAVTAWKFKRVEEMVNEEDKNQKEAAAAVGMSPQWVSKHVSRGEINIR